MGLVFGILAFLALISIIWGKETAQGCFSDIVLVVIYGVVVIVLLIVAPGVLEFVFYASIAVAAIVLLYIIGLLVKLLLG